MNVKNYTIKGKQVSLHFIEQEIDWEGKKEKLEQRELTYGELNDLREECLDIKYVGAQSMVKVSQKKWKELGILKTLVRAPFSMDLSGVQALNRKMGELLEGNFEKLNSEDLKKSDESNTTLTESPLTTKE